MGTKTAPAPPPRPLPLCAKIVVAFLFFGLIFSIVGSIVIPMVFTTIISNIVEEIMVITPNSELYEGWKDPSSNMPVYQGYYFFDVQNKEGILQGEKPQVLEVGPYTYMMNVTRQNITFRDNDTVSYLQYMTYSFVPEMSVGSEEDMITTLNIPFMSAANGAKYKTFWEQISVAALGHIHNYQAFNEISVKDLLWGYKDPMLLHMQGLAGKDLVTTDTFGILHGQNGTNPNWFTVHTGVDNSSLLSTISEWNGTKTLSWWGDKQANMVNGTDGSMFHTGIQKEDLLQLFSPLNFRSMPYEYQYDTSYEGIPLYHFYVPRFAYANPSEYPPNAGFCLEDAEKCVPTGLFNISICSQGAPMLLSHPHFLYGDESLIDAIDGIEPNETIHQNSIDIEPVMGVPFIVNQRIQINMYIEEIGGIGQTYGLKPTYFPILWIDTNGVLPDSMVDKYKEGMKLSQSIGNGARYGCIALGITCLLIAIVVIIYYRDRKHKIRDKQNQTIKAIENEYIALPMMDKEGSEINQNGSTKIDPVPV
ncbi:scavenger receptor class B member 1-like [Amphiura filiformis]|uniref:scavenger receptor class B member 1-like n=1 Tax=Amphiura filiformis TaxID=82378 RepID=UPI003B216CDE